MDTTAKKIQLGERIRVLRESQGLSLRRFALMVGLGKTYLGDVECGKRNIGFENLCKIADGLGVSVAYLVDFDGEIHTRQNT